MDIGALTKKTAALSAYYTALPEPDALRDKAYNAWCKQTLPQLTQILTEHADDLPALTTALDAFLSKAWNLINGTSLSYTAIPNADVTQLFIEVATFAQDNAPEITGTAPLCALQRLMPTLSLESFRDGYPDLNTADIKTVLQTHILGTEGRYLLPVGLVAELKLSPEQTTLENPYYDYAVHPDAAALLRDIMGDEGKRLITHSALTQAVFDKKEAYDALSTDRSNLLGQLNQLCRQLGVNSAAGRGEENDAAMGAYPAISNFMTYFNTLDAQQQDKIPTALKAEIDLLMDLGTNRESNLSATDILETCIATRKTSLISAMHGHDALLSEISLSEQHNAALIDNARVEFESARQSLSAALESGQYAEGHDHLNLTLSLLNVLNVRLRIASRQDLHLIQSLSPDEITALCEPQEIKQQIITQLASLENLVIFIMETSPERIHAFLNTMGTNIISNWIEEPHEVSALLISLDAEKCRVVCVSMPGIIKSGSGFNDILEHLSPEQRSAVFETMKDTLPSIIQSGSNFKHVLEHLSPEQRSALYEVMKDTLPSIIKSGRDFKHVLEHLSPEQRSALYEVMKDTLPSIIKSGRDFKNVLRYLSPEQSSAVIEAMKDTLLGLIKESDDFHGVLEHLSPEQRSAVFETMKGALPSIIQSGSDFYIVLMHLSPEQRSAVFEAMKGTLPSIIQSGGDFYGVLEHLSPEQRSAVFETMKDTLPSIIQSGSDFKHVLEHLSPEQRSAVFETMKDALPSIIQSGSDFKHALEHLSPEQCSALYELMKDTLLRVIQSSGDFNYILEHLSLEQRLAVIEVMKDTLPSIIQSGEGFNMFLECVLPEQRLAVIEVMKDTLPSIIKSGYDFTDVLQGLLPEQCSAWCETMKDTLPSIIKSGEDVNSILDSVPSEQRASVHAAMKDSWLEMIKPRNRYFAHTQRFVEINNALSDTIVNLTRFTANNSDLLSRKTREAVENTIQDFKETQLSLNTHHLNYMLDAVLYDDMTTALDTCCNQLAQAIQTHILPIKTEPGLASLLGQLKVDMVPLAGQSTGIEQTITELHAMTSEAAKRVNDIKSSIKNMRDEPEGPIQSESQRPE